VKKALRRFRSLRGRQHLEMRKLWEKKIELKDLKRRIDWRLKNWEARDSSCSKSSTERDCKIPNERQWCSKVWRKVFKRKPEKRALGGILYRSQKGKGA